MGVFLTILTVVLGLVGLVWASRHLEISRANRVLPPLHSGMYVPSNGEVLPRISVLVAAKDEEQNIEACVRSWMAQDYPDFEIILVNDGSKDKTAEVLEFFKQWPESIVTDYWVKCEANSLAKNARPPEDMLEAALSVAKALDNAKR